MKKSLILRLLCSLLCLCILVAMTGCGGDGENSADTNRELTETEKAHGVLYGGKPYTLKVDLNTLMPSEDTSNPSANKAAQLLADEFMAMYPNVKVEWERTKGDDWSYWMTTQLASGTAPDICFLQGSQYGDRGWFIPLNSWLEKPNIYVSGNTKWKDMFPEYVWESYLCTDAAENIVAVPLTLYPGTATAYYYNKSIFKELGLEIPTEWKDFVDACEKINAAGYVAVAPWKANKKINTGLWDIQFSLGPVFSYALKDKWDLDGSGTMSQSELLKAAYKGVFDLTPTSGGMEMYDLVKYKYTDILQVGAASTDYESLWNEGKVAMMEDGLWRLPEENANTERKFEYGMFPVPVATTATAKNSSDVVYEQGAYNPPIHESYQLVKDTITKKGEGAEEVAVRFIQWLTVPENLNVLIEEGGGAYIGASKGTMIPSVLEDWLQNDFARMPTAQWVMWPTADSYLKMSKQLEMYVRGMIDQNAFITAYNEALKTGVAGQISGLGLDTSTW